MEELQLLVKLVADLPQMALWVLVGFFVYKVIVIGSLYGLIKFVTTQFFKWCTSGKIPSGLLILDDIVMYEEDIHSLVRHLKRMRSAYHNYLLADDVALIGKIIDDHLNNKTGKP